MQYHVIKFIGCNKMIKLQKRNVVCFVCLLKKVTIPDEKLENLWQEISFITKKFKFLIGYDFDWDVL